MKRKGPIDDDDDGDDSCALIEIDRNSFTVLSKQPRLEKALFSDNPRSARPECILFENEAKSLIVLDIPRSLEEAQTLAGATPTSRRIYSSIPVSEPFVLPEPKDAIAMQMALAPSALLQDLMTGASVKAALQELEDAYAGPTYLPRLPKPKPAPDHPQDTHGNSSGKTSIHPPNGAGHLLPPDARPLHGTVSQLLAHARAAVTPSSLDLVILDPPWPNASARRNKRSSPYSTCNTMPDTARLLSSLPLASWLAPGGLIAIWLTNKHAIMPLLANAPRTTSGGEEVGGIFAAWDVEMVTEWVWAKVTSAGEPIFDVDGFYRKPWERLVIARKKDRGAAKAGALQEKDKLQTKVMVAVPDVHSRKPNLRPVFDSVLEPGYTAMEIFARNLTAGWWSWGDDVLKFQAKEWWTGPDGNISESGGEARRSDQDIQLPLRLGSASHLGQ